MMQLKEAMKRVLFRDYPLVPLVQEHFQLRTLARLLEPFSQRLLRPREQLPIPIC
jgi:hypothetical protein